MALAGIMLLTGYADIFHPEAYPLLACLGMTFPIFLLANTAFLLFWLTIKWKRMWIPVAGFLLAYPAIRTYMPLNTYGNTEEADLKVISYNVCTYGGNYKYDKAFEMILDYFAEQKADIVCLQEDVDTWRRYVEQRYKEIYPYNDTTTFVKTATMCNGVGIHTRFPIIRKELIRYGAIGHGSVAYYLKSDSDTLLVINNHLEDSHLNSNDRKRYQRMIDGGMERDTVRAESKMLFGKLAAAQAKRAKQAEAIHEYIEQHRQYPIIICGDFNDTPISYSRRTIAKGLADCFVEAGRGLGLSFCQKGFYFRIDHMMCSANYEPVQCEIDNKFDASDHYPLICWLKKRQNP